MSNDENVDVAALRSRNFSQAAAIERLSHGQSVARQERDEALAELKHVREELQAIVQARALLDADIDRGEREARVEQALAAYAGVKEERDSAVARAQILEHALKNRRRHALEDAAALLDAAASAKRAVEHRNIADACEMQEQAAGLEEAADIVRKLSTSEAE